MGSGTCCAFHSIIGNPPIWVYFLIALYLVLTISSRIELWICVGLVTLKAYENGSINCTRTCTAVLTPKKGVKRKATMTLKSNGSASWKVVPLILPITDLFLLHPSLYLCCIALFVFSPVFYDSLAAGNSLCWCFVPIVCCDSLCWWCM